MDQNTGKGRPVIELEALSLMGNERAKNRRIEGSRGMARLREKRRAAEKAKAERKSRRKECIGWETRK